MDNAMPIIFVLPPIFFYSTNNFNMEELKQPSDDVFELSDAVYEQIKDFDHDYLTEEQKLLVDKLILDEELKNNYKKNGLCEKCRQPKNSWMWCQICNFQQNFKNWTSGNHNVDKFIQKTQLKAQDDLEVLEWIEYDRFEMLNIWPKVDLELLLRQFGKMVLFGIGIPKIINGKDKTYREHPNYPVALKCLHNSQDITTGFLSEV